MQQRSVRGAITISSDDRIEVLEATKELLREIISENKIDVESIVNIIFTTTLDIRSEFPPLAAREIGLGDVPLLNCQEMDCEKGLKLCIRAMLTYNTDKNLKDIKHIYKKGAKVLRPDLVKS